MANQTVGYADLTSLAANLAAASGKSFHEAAVRLVQSVGDQELTFAKAYAPNKTGRLRDSITETITNGGLTATVGTDVPYAAYVEFGTGPRGEFPSGPIVIYPKNAKFLKFTVNGKTIFAKKVVSQGMAPRPFLRPALERVVTPFGDSLMDLGVVSIVKGPNAPETLMNAPATSPFGPGSKP